jgi:hypothetical protein
MIRRYRCPTVENTCGRGMISLGWTGSSGAPGTKPPASSRSMPAGRFRYRKWVSEASPDGISASCTPGGRCSDRRGKFGRASLGAAPIAVITAAALRWLRDLLPLSLAGREPGLAGTPGSACLAFLSGLRAGWGGWSG